MHIPKTGGRTVDHLLRGGILGQRPCDWAPWRGRMWGNKTKQAWMQKFHVDDKRDGLDFNSGAHEAYRGAEFRIRREVRVRQAELRRDPCYITFEYTWAKIEAAFGPPALPPFVVTVLRDPASWLLSSIEHVRTHDKKAKATDKVPWPNGVDDTIARGCLAWRGPGEDRACPEYTYDFGTPFPFRFLWSAAATNGGPAPTYAAARKRIDAIFLGMTEHLSASICLWKFQFGLGVNKTECDCRRVHERGELVSQHVGRRKYAKQQPVAVLRNT